MNRQIQGARMLLLPLYRRIGLKLLIGFAAAISAMIFFAWLADEVLAGSTQTFDEKLRAMIHQHASPALTYLMRVATSLGSAPVLVPLGVCAGVGFLLAGWRRGTILFAITMAGALLLDVTLKLSFHRRRPVPFFDIEPPSTYSFPSGHALISFCFYGALAAIIGDRIHSRAGRIALWMSAAFLVAAIGFSRIYLGVHYPSDVLAGYGAAFVWVMMVALVDRLIRPRITT